MLRDRRAWMLVFLAQAAYWPALGSAAGSPQRIGFQGKLLDTSNNPRNGSFDMTFRVFDVAAGGSELWSETQTGVPVNNGVFSVQLGDVVSLSVGLFNRTSAYLEVEVAPDAAMTPRQLLLMSPYAFRALLADDLAPGNTSYVQVTGLLQSGAVFHVASGTVAGPFTATGTANFTAAGNQTYSIQTSSGIRLAAGTLRVEGSGGVDSLTVVKGATVAASTGLLLPQGSASSLEGSARWDAAQNLLFIGTGTANKTMADTDSAQTLTNKTLSSSGGNVVDATHLRARLLSSVAPFDGMTIKWDAAGSQWVPAYAAKVSIIATPFTPAGNLTLVSSTVYITPLVVPGTLDVNQIRYRVTTGVSGITGDVGLYDSAGNLVLSGGASSANFTTVGAKVVAVSGAPVTVQPGQYYLALSCNGAPAVRGNNLQAASAGVVPRLGTIALGAGTTLPSSIVLGSIVDGNLAIFQSLNE